MARVCVPNKYKAHIKISRPMKRDKVKMNLRSEGTRVFETSVHCRGVRVMKRIKWLP